MFNLMWGSIDIKLIPKAIYCVFHNLFLFRVQTNKKIDFFLSFKGDDRNKSGLQTFSFLEKMQKVQEQINVRIRFERLSNCCRWESNQSIQRLQCRWHQVWHEGESSATCWVYYRYADSQMLLQRWAGRWRQSGELQLVYRQKLWPISWSWILSRRVDVKHSLQATNSSLSSTGRVGGSWGGWRRGGMSWCWTQQH